MTKRQKKDPKRTIAIKSAYWNKWGGDPNRVIRTKGITKDEWSIQDITNPAPENVTNITHYELDKALRNEVK